ncbi:hypothetical protein GCM10022220_08280 [Actinocatenispora rupis]|uniref:Uncharacterized protein n=2 Tax=Actinocatenispora rupis TaxID=519421 RepID=A0A8J3N8C9_9ACTN|nr:hypothetical protein Aru02nite_10630 [Actinocatenispora rupis]
MAVRYQPGAAKIRKSVADQVDGLIREKPKKDKRRAQIVPRFDR